MKSLASALFMMAALLFSAPCNAESQKCADEAIAQAQRLLEFHFGADERIEIDKKIKEITAIQNPTDKKQKFQVLEVWGYIYKGRYRMRLIYFQMDKECVLMGQEILEHAKL